MSLYIAFLDRGRWQDGAGGGVGEDMEQFFSYMSSSKNIESTVCSLFSMHIIFKQQRNNYIVFTKYDKNISANHRLVLTLLTFAILYQG